jgi:hypothetical protein
MTPAQLRRRECGVRARRPVRQQGSGVAAAAAAAAGAGPQHHAARVHRLEKLAESAPSLQSAAVLGWTRDGDHLVGYDWGDPIDDAGDGDEGDTGCTCHLRLWRVRHCNGTATPIWRARLFAPAVFGSDEGSTELGTAPNLAIEVAESQAQDCFVVVGTEDAPSGGDDAGGSSCARMRHVTVLPSPLRFSRCARVSSWAYMVTPPLPPLDLTRWWLPAARSDPAHTLLVLNRGDCIDVFYISIVLSVPSHVQPQPGGCGAAAEASCPAPPPQKRAGGGGGGGSSAWTMPLVRATSCWTRDDSAAEMGVTCSYVAGDGTDERRRRQRRQQQQQPVAQVVLRRATFHIERLLPFVFRPALKSQRLLKRPPRITNYNLQLAAPLDTGPRLCISMLLTVATLLDQQHRPHGASRPAATQQQQQQQQQVSAFLVVVDVVGCTVGWQRFSLSSALSAEAGRQPPSPATRRQRGGSIITRAQHWLYQWVVTQLVAAGVCQECPGDDRRLATVLLAEPLVWDNTSVTTGHSLTVLRHPHLPLMLRFGGTNR